MAKELPTVTHRGNVVGITGLDQSRKATITTIGELTRVGLPMVATTLSADTLDDHSPLYYQVSPQNRREAEVAAAYAGHLADDGRLKGRRVRVVYSADPTDEYSRNLRSSRSPRTGPHPSTPKPTQCDELPFAKSKQSGAQQGVTSGKVCQQYNLMAQTLEGKEYLSLTWPGLKEGKMPPANAKCARASMPKNQNEGVGGDLGRFTKAQRLLGGDGYWVDAGNKP